MLSTTRQGVSHLLMNRHRAPGRLHAILIDPAHMITSHIQISIDITVHRLVRNSIEVSYAPYA
jgi:hypothetical protein